MPQINVTLKIIKDVVKSKAKVSDENFNHENIN